MADIYSAEGDKLGTIGISPQEMDLLVAGVTTMIRFHTPRMLQGMLGMQRGWFELSMQNGRIIASDIAAVKRYLALQHAIVEAGKMSNA